jgi:hypothetical protein
MAGVWVCTAQGGGKERGRAIEFSAPKSDEVTTNLHQLTSKKDSLKQLEEDLYKSVQTFAPKSSLDGVAAPPARTPTGPVILSKRVKELLERRKNWAFVNPKDLMSGPTAEEIFKVPEYGADGQEKKRVSLVEQYYEQLGAKRAGEMGPSPPKDDGRFGEPNQSKQRDDPAVPDDANLPTGLRESEQALKKFFESDPGEGGLAPTPARNPFSDIFGLGDTAPSREKALEHKKLMDEFNHILDFSRQPALSPNSPGGSSDATRWSANPVSGLEGSWGSSRHDGFGAPSGAINPILTPSGPLDVNAQALGPSSLTPAVPKTDLPKVAPPTPTFTAPRRAF